MTTPTTQATMTPGQLGCILNDIAQSAMQISELQFRLSASIDDLHMADLLAGAIGALAQRIGWEADLAAARVPGAGGAAFGDAERWMMPPSFHWGDEPTAEAGGNDHG